MHSCTNARVTAYQCPLPYWVCAQVEVAIAKADTSEAELAARSAAMRQGVEEAMVLVKQREAELGQLKAGLSKATDEVCVAVCVRLCVRCACTRR